MIRKSIRILMVLCLVIAVLLPTVALAESTSVKTPAADGAANIRSGAGPGFDVVGWGLNGDKLEILSKGSIWYQVKLVKNGRIGYIHSQFVSMSGTSSAPTTGDAGRVATNFASSRVNLRKTAGTSGEIVTSLPSGAKLIILETSGNWYKVRGLAAGQVGYMSKSYVESGFSGKATGDVNLRAGAGTGNGILKVIPKGGSLTVLSVGGSWSQVKYSGTTGYISNQFLSY